MAASGGQQARAAALAGGLVALGMLVLVGVVSAMFNASSEIALFGRVPLPPPRFSRAAARSAGLRDPESHPSMQELKLEHQKLQRQLQILRELGHQHGMMLSGEPSLCCQEFGK